LNSKHSHRGLSNQVSDAGRAKYTLTTAIYMLGAWLYLRCGLSRERASKTIEFVFHIALFAITIGMSAAGGSNPTSFFSPVRDVRTAINHLSIEPDLRRRVCCPKCYAPYSVDNLPSHCQYRETRRSKLCGSPLWTRRRTRKGSICVPRRLYTTQSFSSWLEWFLSRPGIEDKIDLSYKHRRPSGGIMRDIWDSPA
jgi:hypothetical protein